MHACTDGRTGGRTHTQANTLRSFKFFLLHFFSNSRSFLQARIWSDSQGSLYNQYVEPPQTYTLRIDPAKESRKREMKKIQVHSYVAWGLFHHIFFVPTLPWLSNCNIESYTNESRAGDQHTLDNWNECGSVNGVLFLIHLTSPSS